MMRSNWRMMVGLFATVVYSLSGCQSQTPPANETPPEIPPESTFVMDFSDFETGGEPTTRVAQPAPGLNWGFAALTVGVWDVILTVGMAVPVAAFVESFQHEPQQLEDGTWEWAYSFRVLGVQHTAKLHALAEGGDINWTMLISKEGAYTDFEWYTGVSNLVGTEGMWILNRDPSDPEPFVQIDWTRSSDGQTGTLQYTNIVPGASQNGSYVQGSISDNEPYDAIFQLFDQAAENLTEIEWNLTTEDGRVQDERHFEDTGWHCWDEELQNVDCE
jgi:hypothetical protein